MIQRAVDSRQKSERRDQTSEKEVFLWERLSSRDLRVWIIVWTRIATKGCSYMMDCN